LKINSNKNILNENKQIPLENLSFFWKTVHILK
jgi:hypothetical protein